MERRTDALTAEQKDALRFALTLTSEQIAPLLGISKKAVDKRIDTARARLNGMGRRQAAELLAREEGRLDGGDIIPPAKIPLDNARAFPASGASPETVDGPGSTVPGLNRVPRRNTLDPFQRLGVIALLIALLGIVSAAYVAALHLR